LYYLEQYTSGQSRELVKTCLFLDPDIGFAKAKELLLEHFGNEYQIASAYIKKALSWSSIRAEDSQTLKSFALYLRGCLNAINEIAYMDELNLASNLKLLVGKLPYKLRERWRAEACHFQESTNRRATFKILVEFIERQVKILMDPVFGDIQDPSPIAVRPTHSSQTVRPTHSSVVKSKFTDKSFTANAATIDVNPNTPQQRSNAATVQQRPFCLFCSGEHLLRSCSWFKKKLHTDKISFLKERGICLACLVTGHISIDCTPRLTCIICNRAHPTALHIGKVGQNKGVEKQETPKETNKDGPKKVNTGQISLKAGNHTGAGEISV
jgi:hypothetical protein